MKKATLDKEVAVVMADTKAALQTVYDALNQGQQKKIVKEPQVKARKRFLKVSIPCNGYGC